MSEIKVNSVVNSTGDNDSGLDLSTNDQVDIKIANTTKVRVDSSGRVLIGTDSGDAFNADAMLRLQRTGDRIFQSFKVDADQSAGIFFGDVNDDIECGITYEATNQNLIFSTGNNSEAMRIDSSGKLLINTTSATSAEFISMNVDSGVNFGIGIKSTNTANNCVYLKFYNSSGSQAGVIQQSGSTSTSYTTSSDYRLKENISYEFDATKRIKKLKPCTFNFIGDGKDRVVDGFLAHEVSSIVPEAISGEKDAVDADGNIEPQGIDQSKIVPLVTKALQEAIAKIETLEAEIAKLKG